MLTAIEEQNFHAVIPAAQDAMRKYKVPASVSLAQWMPESSWGQSLLARAPNFNQFGIKFHHFDGSEIYVAMETPEYVNGRRVIELQEFQKYGSITESFDDHGRLLEDEPRYSAAMELVADPVAFAGKLGICGYSTTPNYGEFIGSFIREYNLTQYDVKD